MYEIDQKVTVKIIYKIFMSQKKKLLFWPSLKIMKTKYQSLDKKLCCQTINRN